MIITGHTSISFTSTNIQYNLQSIFYAISISINSFYLYYCKIIMYWYINLNNDDQMFLLLCKIISFSINMYTIVSLHVGLVVKEDKVSSGNDLLTPRE